jgi:hypothetical protein
VEGALGLVGFEEKVEGRTCVVKAIGGGGRAQGVKQQMVAEERRRQTV